MTFWAENLGSAGFYVCLREMISFSGKHENLYIVSDGHSTLCFIKYTSVDAQVERNLLTLTSLKQGVDNSQQA